MAGAMISAVGAAAYSINAQFDRLNRSAARLADAAGAEAPASQEPDYIRETVEQMNAAHGVEANIAVLKTADQMVGTLFDIWA